MRLQLSKNSVRAADRLNLPGQGQKIAPMAVSMKQAPEQSVVEYGKSPFELPKPVVHDHRSGFCSGPHGTSNQAVAASAGRSLVHARQNGRCPSVTASARVQPKSLSA